MIVDMALACCGCLVATWALVIMAFVLTILGRVKEGENERQSDIAPAAARTE